MKHLHWTKRLLICLLLVSMLSGMAPDGFFEGLGERARAEGETVLTGDALSSGDGWLYVFRTDGNAAITGYADATVRTLTVPASLGGAWVVALGEGAFSGLSALESLTVPSSVTDIASGAFTGLSGVTIRAYNGSAALLHASAHGLAAENLSAYDFYDDVLDLSDMRASQFSYQGSDAVRISAPFSRTVDVGDKLFLPPGGRYAKGFPCTVTAVSQENGYAVLRVTALDFMDTVASYHEENALLTPDRDNIVVMQEGLTLLESAPASRASVTMGTKLQFGVNFTLYKGTSSEVSLSGTFSVDPRYTITVDVGWFTINEFSYTSSITTEYDISVSYRYAPDLLRKNDKELLLGKIPLVSAGLITAWFKLSLVFSVTGEIHISASIVNTEQVTWRDGQLTKTSNKKTNYCNISKSITIGLELKGALSITVGFGVLSADVAELAVSIGIYISFTTNELSPLCTDVSIKGVFKITLKLGLLPGLILLDSELFRLEWKIWSGHREGSIDQWTDKCLNGVVRVSFSGMGYPMPPDQMLYAGSKVTRPNDPRYSIWGTLPFAGWYKDTAHTQPWDFDDEDVYEDTTLYSGWIYPFNIIPAPVATPTPKPSVTSTPQPTLTSEEQNAFQYLLFEYSTESGEKTASVVGYQGEPRALTLPRWVEHEGDWYKLTQIGDDAFQGCESLTNVSIADGVTSIGLRAFENCINLIDAYIPDTVTFIDGAAFAGCYSLTDINIPKGITSINDGVFYECHSLPVINIPDGVTSIGNEAFSYCYSLSEIDIPDGVTSIGHGAFTECHSLIDVRLPDSVYDIGDAAFAGCEKLLYIDMPDHLADFRSGLFAGCQNLSGMSIPYGVTTIGPNAFSDCMKLSYIRIPHSVTQIFEFAFENCISLTDIHIPDSVTDISVNAFSGCQNLTDINIPDSVGGIGSFAFSGCQKLTNICIPNSLVGIAPATFIDCTNLSAIRIPSSVYIIESTAFENCPALATLVTSPGSYAEQWFKENMPAVNILYSDENALPVFFSSLGGSSVEPAYLLPGELVPQPAPPVRTNYAFSGWYKDKACTQTWDFARDRMPSRKLTLYAGWLYNPGGLVYEESGAVLRAASPDGGSSRGASGVTVTGYTGDDTHLVIPDTLGGQPVTALGANTIGGGIYKVTLPASMTRIEPDAFQYASDLRAILCDEGNPAFRSVDGVLYSADGTTLVCYPSAKTTSAFAVPDGVTALGERAFYDCERLASLTMPASLATLADYAIARCLALTDVRFTADPTVIGTGVFSGCGGLTDLRLYGPVVADNLVAAAEAYLLDYNVYEVCYMLGDQPLGYIGVRAGNAVSAPTIPTGADSPYADRALAGWSRAQGGALFDFVAEVMPQEDLVLYSVWRYDFTYEAVEGGMRLLKYIGSAARTRVPTTVDNLPVLEIAPDAFDGTASITLQGDRGSVAEAFALANSLPFEALTYTLSFDTDGGTYIAPRTLYATDAFTAPEIVKTGHELTAWYIDAARTIAWGFENGVMPASDLTLYAAWEKTDPDAADVQFMFTTGADGLTLTRYTGSLTTVVLPSEINGVPVVAIGDYAFADTNSMFNVTIPDSVKTVGAGAFAGSRLDNVTLGDGVTSIGENAFSGCEELRGVTFGNALVSMGESAFHGCALLSAVALPDGLTALPSGAFAYCENLTTVTLPTRLESVASGAFTGCTRLESLHIGASVYEFAPDAVTGCSHLRSITVADGNMYYQSIDGVLFSADGGTLQRYPEGKEDAAYTTPVGVTYIADYAMENNHLTTFALGAQVDALGYAALRGGVRLETVTFSENGALGYVGESAFAGCTSLAAVSLPASLATLGKNAFAGCGALASVTAPGTLSFIGEGAIPANAGTTIYGSASSAAETYAVANNIRFVDVRRDVPITCVSLPASLALTLYASTTLTVVLAPDDTTERDILWTTSDASVATVGADGCVTGIYEGNALITATAANGASASCAVTVEPPAVLPERVTLANTVFLMNSGFTNQLAVYLYPENVTDRTLTWTSENPNVVDIVSGRLVAKSSGSATVRVQTVNGLSAECLVLVDQTTRIILPGSFTRIEPETFMGAGMLVLECQQGLESIGAHAFKDCEMLVKIVIPDSVTQIAEDAFEGCRNVVIYCAPGSEAERYANEHNIAHRSE